MAEDETRETEKSKKSNTKKRRRFFDSIKNKDEKAVNDHVETFDLSEKVDIKNITSNKNIKGKKTKDTFDGPIPLAKHTVNRYTRGHEVDEKAVRTKYRKAEIIRNEKKIYSAMKDAARAEMLLNEQAGFLEADEGEHTSQYTQEDITKIVDVQSKQKYFEVKLDNFGPYRINYTRNGRFVLLGGEKGHVAAFDWQTKQLTCEMNVMETINDIQWLHTENMFAVAQRLWTYIYDNQGIEIHCLKALDRVLRLEFLPYHFLLVSANEKSYLSFIDISVGKKVAGFPTAHGRLDVMTQNPYNAITLLGHNGGTVSMWSPNVKQPLVKMLCHRSATRCISVEQSGQYMATSGIDGKVKIWDLRTYKLLHSYKVGSPVYDLSFSQRNLLAAAVGDVVQIYKNSISKEIDAPYMCQRSPGFIRNLAFCPFEDVLGTGHSEGFSSYLIPGAGEPNFDALEANPYQTKKQRRQAEVKMLLDKIQPDLIGLDNAVLGKVDRKSAQEILDEKKKLLYLKPQKVDFVPRYKKKGGSKTGKIEKRKKGVQWEDKRNQLKERLLKKKMKLKNNQTKKLKKEILKESKLEKRTSMILNRFQKKDS